MMTKDGRRVAVDADFFRKMSDKDVDGKLFLRIMAELNIEPVMHEYVYNYELAGNSVVRKLKENEMITVYQYSDFISDINREA